MDTTYPIQQRAPWGRRRSPRWQLAACASMHVVNDALFAGLYPLLPLVAADLALSYAQVGAIKTVYSGASAVLQIPAGFAAERLGEHALLALGTGWVGAGLLGMALAAGFWPLLALSLLAGFGGSAQHPVASSIVSRAFDGGRRATAIGTLNFAGDVGKVLAPLLVGGITIVHGWRGGFVALGGAGVLFALVYLFLRPPDPGRASPARPPHPHSGDPRGGAAPQGIAVEREGAGGDDSYSERSDLGAGPAARNGWGIERPGLFSVLAGIGVLDSAARGAALVLIPFLLQDKGFDAASLSFYFAVLFGAGAAGKFICGPLADRYGNVVTIVVTELVTAGALVGLLIAPGPLVLVALLPLGFVLNGTSSVLYATVADLVHASRRARGYGLYYTCSLLASAVAPILYGALADRTGLGPTFVTLAAATALIVPLTLAAGRGLRQPAARKDG